MMTQRFSASLMLGTLAVLAAPVGATASEQRYRQKTVKVSATDFANESAVKRLNRRISSAARSVCETGASFDPPGRTEALCTERAKADAQMRLAEIRLRHRGDAQLAVIGPQRN